MGTRILIIILFFLSVATSSAVTYYMISSNKAGAGSADVSAAVAKFIEEKPEVIIQSLRKAQQARAEQEEQESQKTAVKLRPQLEKNPTDGFTGNKDGDVIMVGFIDHNCGFCKKSLPDIEKLVTEDKSLKFVLKDYPILGPSSIDKAKASIAIARIAPDKWYNFYDKLGHSNTQTVEQLMELAQKETGVDQNLLKSEMESSETQNKLAENKALGEQLGVSGTPVFIVNGQVLRGALGYDAFKQAVEAARAANKG